MTVIRSVSSLRKFGPRSVGQLLTLGCFLLFQIYFFGLYRGVETSAASATSEVFIDDGHNALSRPYQRLINTNADGFKTSAYADKCTAYFDLLYNEDAMWRSSDFKELPYTRYIFESEKKYIDQRLKEWKDGLEGISEEQKNQKAEKEQIVNTFRLEYQAKAKETRETEDRLVESATHLRVYGACYLDQYGHFNRDTKAKENKCHDIESRLFQWLSRRMPTYTRWDGTSLKSMPIMSDYIEDQIPEQQDLHEKPEISSCYMKTFRDSLNGRGLVISAADMHVEQLVSLFAVLRASGNTLPIQVVHSGDLSKEAQKVLIDVARKTENLVFDHIDNLEAALASKNLTVPFEDYVVQSEVPQLFPPLELWFVDVSAAVSKAYRSKFNAYANKLLAYFFSSFQHTVLIDTDTMPVADIDKHILQSPFYLKDGAYFFKDREIHYQNRGSDVRFFTKLMPSKIDHALFGITPVTEKTLGNRFVKLKFQHLQESGVVAIDKRRHFTGVLSTLQLQIWSPAAAIVWGDKELFWLGMSMAGDEDYYMNHWAAGSAGFITPKDWRLANDPDDSRRKKLIGNEVCSTHPAHMSSVDNSTLLWYNSGFNYCKKDGAYRTDIKNNMFKNVFQSVESLQQMYEGYHHIEAVIVPKHGEFFRKSDRGENQRGWQQSGECKHFLFCAYDKVGGVDDPDSNGLLVEFDDATKRKYNFYGSCAQYAPEIFGFKDKL